MYELKFCKISCSPWNRKAIHNAACSRCAQKESSMPANVG